MDIMIPRLALVKIYRYLSSQILHPICLRLRMYFTRYQQLNANEFEKSLLKPLQWHSVNVSGMLPGYATAIFNPSLFLASTSQPIALYLSF
jgi:hypothetical protein